MKGRFRNITIISVHAPTGEKDEEEKETFYDQLDDTCNKVKKYDMAIVMGDLNAKIGKETHLSKVAGKHAIHEKTNDNGNMLAQFAKRNRFIIKSTIFPHKNIHMGTWKIPGSSEVNQIDHILVTQRHSTSVLDVRSCRGPNCDSDHYLVKAKIRERIIKTEKGPEMVKRRWDTDKLNEDTEVRKQYQKALARKEPMFSEKYKNESITSHIVLDLSESVLDKGYTLYLGNQCTSSALVDKLTARCTDVVGTMQSNRNEFPSSVKLAKLNVSDTSAAFRGKQMVMKWKDKLDKKSPTRRCVICCKKGALKETRYWYPECGMELCPAPRFRVYHTKANITNLKTTISFVAMKLTVHDSKDGLARQHSQLPKAQLLQFNLSKALEIRLIIFHELRHHNYVFITFL
ncbi:hypothetical protein J437_LFUL017543 [Ladona fulva]|uniref:PiggyBac transposable element-derived protein domain-containing protein n=1 Tax=Ladona fulva TaxID=123851 RepID=A0A8K0KP47_LADFU|nr:hypothetical protein J437_LFUL017543 [Ladona fulva]